MPLPVGINVVARDETQAQRGIRFTKVANADTTPTGKSKYGQVCGNFQFRATTKLFTK